MGGAGLGAMMPAGLLWPVLGLSVVLLAWALTRFRDADTRVLITAVWLRYAMSAIHPITFPPVVGGVSLNALGSILVVVAGLTVLKWKLLRLAYLAPIYALIAVCIVSALVNGRYAGLVNFSIKLTYLVVLICLAYAAIMKHGVDRLMSGLLVAFFVPLTLQMLSFVFGLSKATEIDHSASYIGGYFHEAAFSVIIVTFLYVGVFLRERTGWREYAFLALGLFGLALANYRTTLIGVLPPLGAFMLIAVTRPVKREQRAFVLGVAGAICVAGFGALAIAFADRFKDIGLVLELGPSLVRPPSQLTFDESRLLSGRIHIWSEYIYGYLQGDAMVRLLGYGPDSWVGLMSDYAHNTFVSYLYEFGVIGFSLIVVLFAQNIYLCSRLGMPEGFVLAAGFGGFLVLNLATMPMWQIEGNILFSLILATLWRQLALRRATASRPRVIPATMRPALE